MQCAVTTSCTHFHVNPAYVAGGGEAAYLPVVEHGQSEGLALRVRAQVGLEAERVDGRDERLDGVQRRAWDGCVLGDVTPERRQTQDDK